MKSHYEHGGKRIGAASRNISTEFRLNLIAIDPHERPLTFCLIFIEGRKPLFVRWLCSFGLSRSTIGPIVASSEFLLTKQTYPRTPI